MHRVSIQLRVDGYRRHPHFSAGSDDSYSDFASVGYQHFLEHLPNVDIVNGQRRTLGQEISSDAQLSSTATASLRDLGYDLFKVEGRHSADDSVAVNDAARIVSPFTVWHTNVTGSTNVDLGALPMGHATAGLVLITDHQEAGRGRQQRQWIDHPGSALLSSVFWPVSAVELQLLPLAVGLAVADAVDLVAGGAGILEPSGTVSLKWPNDVLVPGLAGRKLAGILVEVTQMIGDAGPGSFGAVIGMGLNVRQSNPMPPAVANRATTLAETVAAHNGDEKAASRDQMLLAYLQALKPRLATLADREATLGAYRQRCLTLGRQVRFDTAKGAVTGEAVDIDDEGALVIQDGKGKRHHLNSGDAHHL